MGYIPINPAVAVDYLSTHEAKAQKGTFAPEEIAKLLEAAPSNDWRGVILLAAFAGMRLGDALRFDTPIETAEFCRALVEEKMSEAFVEMFGDTVPWKSTPRCVPTGARSESVLINTYEPNGRSGQFRRRKLRPAPGLRWFSERKSSRSSWAMRKSRTR